ncbi:MAG: tetraacyldisaccharide 4'-kinase, partial [Verrucomicrobia bacterium]|nr:tetraacyldisaccharide 4'-kinase [Verrucomicrobiota bacterium]
SAPLLRPMLALCSKLYAVAVKGRHLAYQKKWLPAFSADVPTVSIGNIVVGGTGKTPLVLMLATALQEEGKIAILTRGFRSQAEKRSEPLCIDKEHTVSAEICGDEPLFLAQTTLASIWIGPDRVLSAKKAAAAGAVCLILDDGLQHRRLRRDVEIVAIDANDPFSRHRFLPYGLLRDLPERLREADLIVANHTRDNDHYEEVKKELSAYTQAPIVAMQHTLVQSEPLQGHRIGAFCGIGKPQYFFNALKRAGAEIVATCALLDHQGFPREKLQAFVTACREKGAASIVCTEKDWVKLQPSEMEHGIPIRPIAMRLNIIAGKEHWDSAIDKIKQKIKVFR